MTRTRFKGGGQADPYGTMGDAHKSVTHYASQHAGSDEEDHSVFSSVISNLMNKDDHLDTNDDELEHAKNSRQRIYQDGEEATSPRDIGSAAAAEAMEKHRSNGESGGMNALLGMAMGEAAKLFAKQGGGSGSAGKTEAIQQAAMMVMKMYASKQGGSGSSGSSGGGLGSVMSLLAAAQGGSGGGSSGGLGGMVSSVLGGGGSDHKQSSGGSDLASKLIGKFL